LYSARLPVCAKKTSVVLNYHIDSIGKNEEHH